MLQTTRWSVVVAARGSDTRAQTALAQLCGTYRSAVLAYSRRHARNTEEAEDLTQAFFVEFLEHAIHAHADPARGRFRAFLFTALSRFINHVRERDHASKRGGGASHVPLDGELADTLADDDVETPEREFERAWAGVVLDRALQRLQEEAEHAGNRELFEQLRDLLVNGPDPTGYGDLAARLGLRPNTIAVRVHRLRERLGELVRDELAQTVADPASLREELRALRAALSGT